MQQAHETTLQLQGVGKQIAKHLERLNIFSIIDLLFHLPTRYQDRTKIQAIKQLLPGCEAVVEGVVHYVTQPGRGRTKLLCELHDDDGGRLFLRFFHVLPFQKEVLQVGTRIRCFSEPRLGPKGMEMVHPEFKVIHPDKPLAIDENLTPIYPATEGLSQYTLRKLTHNALQWMENTKPFPELIPPHLLKQHDLPTVMHALQFIHRPPSHIVMDDLLENKTQAQKRLIFEELLAHRLSLLYAKQAFQKQTAMALADANELSQQFIAKLPYQLTNAQKRVIAEITHDLQRAYPMLRLVQGDVGSGKTVVAAMAMLKAVQAGYQAALMAPTELLAEQHHRVFKAWFEPLGIHVVYLASQIKAQARRQVLQAMASGEAAIIIGTHALFQKEVEFAKLALIIVDEQHRFGVHQRAMFREKGMQTKYYPHQLVMTATPIPRTLAMSFYADLDCSTIDELPPGRTPIATSVICASKRDEIIARIDKACLSGKQVYWVCPLIEESEVIACQAATQTAEQLQQRLPHLTIGLLHGKMSSQDKETMMRQFQQGDMQLLVATTVIEVGVDVPNASVMVIENAERLGLAQLHQLRGRVGRGSVASHCLLLYQQPLSAVAKERLSVMRESTDGFKIAQHDLTLRGPGEVLGTRQTGELSFRVADLMRDREMLSIVQQAADDIIKHCPEIIPALIERWLASGSEYAKV